LSEQHQPASLHDAARRYLAAGLCVLAAHRDEKRPTVSWKPFQTRLPTEAEVDAWLANGPSALCLLAGRTSGHLETIDFDLRAELYEAWAARVEQAAPGLVARLVISQTQSGGRHVTYRCPSGVSGNLKLAQRRTDVESSEPVVLAGKTYVPRQDAKRQWYVVVTLIETRGEGGIFLCDPTPGYRITQGDLCNPPVVSEDERDVLLGCAWELNEYLPQVVDGPQVSAENADNAGLSADNSHRAPSSADNTHPGAPSAHNTERPGDDFNSRGDVRAVLAQHGWALARGGENEYWRRPGKTCGWSATLKDRVFYVFTSNAPPFEPNRPYSPFAVYALLHHGGDFAQAARELRELGYGAAPSDHGVDISHIVAMSAENGSPPPENAHIADPGPIPERLFDVPGFVARVMDFTLASAPYPNVGLAFSGAMSLLSYLTGRKVCDEGDLRTNLYLLALASSGTGKDFPRKVNARVLFDIGHAAALGDKFASGEGIQDALLRNGAMLFQNDEMDGVLRQINLDRENRRESIPNVLMTVYTAASDIYPVRVKANQKEAATIDQPHLVLFGTATPQYFYEALSQRMLTNGFFARLIIVDIGQRGEGQEPRPARNVPDAVLEIARWWAEYNPHKTRRNLLEVHPHPKAIHAEPEAKEALTALQRATEAEYRKADKQNDEVARVAWSRTHENAKKLSLLRAVSENHEEPLIRLPAVEWATEFAMHQTRRQLFLAQTYVAENAFHADCLKVIRKLRDAPGHELPHSVLLKRMKMNATAFRDLVETLRQRGEVLPVTVTTTGRPGLVYRLVGVKDGERT